MAKNFVQEGETLTWLNSTGAAVASGVPIMFGLWCMAITLVDIAISETGSVATEGVFNLPKAAGAIAQGGGVWWDNVNKNCINAPALNSYFLGYAATAVLTGATTVDVILEEFNNENNRIITLPATGAQTLNAGDFASGEVILLCPNTAAQTVNLPSVALVPIGTTLFVKKTDAAAFAITLDPAGSELIAGGATYATVDTLNEHAKFVNTGTAWALLATAAA